TILAATAVTAAYGPRLVLHECSFALASGEVVAIVGPNGAGKSTLLRVLAGLLRPTAGRVLLDGEDLAALSRSKVARRIAVVPQIFDTLFPFTVREVVALGRTARLGAFGRASPDDVAAVDRAIDELELGPLASRRIDRLSGGERQRAVLAMALAQESDVLLLDEPTVHLDPAHQVAMLRLIRELACARGLAVVAVLHDLNLAASMATRLAVLADGRLICDAAPETVINAELIAAQADAMAVPLVQRGTAWHRFDGAFGDTLDELVRDGIDGIVFGDIHLADVRAWYETRVRAAGLTHVEPLWGEDPGELLAEFVATGGRAVVTCCESEKLDDSWLGRVIDERFVGEIAAL